jgi:DNA-binding transcriptional LysR family regulator
MRRLPLADLEAFAAVAEMRSFRKAAALRGISATSLSDAMRRLEARLGVRLLTRTTRSVTLTDAGQQLLARLSPALGDIASMLDGLGPAGDTPSGTLRLNVPGIVARYILPPIVVRFLKAYPRVSIEIVAEDVYSDVFAKGFDAGVRYDERLELDMIAVPIGPRSQRFIAVASPAYLKIHGTPSHPEDLLKHTCIRHRFLSGVMPTWEFEREGVVVRVDPPSVIITNSLDISRAAAVAGLGIMTSFSEFTEAEVASGALQPVLEDWLPPFSGPFIYYPSRKHMPPPLRAFLDFLKTEMAAT